MRFLITILLSLVALATAADLEMEFSGWAKRHGKVYLREELPERFQIWKQNLAWIESHNANAEKEGRTYTVALNKLADMTQDEYRQLLGFRPEAVKASVQPPSARLRVHRQLPGAWDWRTKGAVLPVQNQGQCGSCYAFTTLDAVSGMWFQKTSLLLELSVQEALDCASQNDGCSGGFPSNVYQWIISNKGICLWQDYPYTAGYQTCGAANCTNVATIRGSVNVKQGDELALQNAVYQTVVASAVNAMPSSFQFYSGGVYNDASCNNQINHGMTNVGWGVDPQGGNYWILRNMWSENWGERGYMRIARGKDLCGLADAASYPTF